MVLLTKSGPLTLHCACRQKARHLALSSLGLLVLMLWPVVGANDVQAEADWRTEYEVKGAFLYNFAKFVEWPTDAFPGPEAFVRICVLGQDPFGDDLAQLVEGKTVNGRRLQIVHVRDVQQAKACQILFVASSERQQIGAILQSLTRASVLTVGDTPGFAQAGGVINFVLDQDRVRFEINLKAAERARLKISARLLTVAKLVSPREQPGGN